MSRYTIYDKTLLIWEFSLYQNNNLSDFLIETLSAGEKYRANSYTKAIDRERFIISRGMLRCLLSNYVNIKPHDIHFEPGQYGKPLLSKNQNSQGVAFNFSRSYQHAVCAISRATIVGIDIEYVKGIESILEIAKNFFTPNEYRTLCDAPNHRTSDLFYRIWTRKEAFVKAIGVGLQQPLDSFEVNFLDDLDSKITSPTDNKKLVISNLDLSVENYVGALTYEPIAPTIKKQYLNPSQILPWVQIFLTK